MKQKLRSYLILVPLFVVGFCITAEARQITDMAGRQVTVPDVINTVYGTSPPATYMIYALDPGLIAGLNFPFNQSEKDYLDPRLQKLPVVGGWFGQGRVANLETLLQVHPDIILVWMWQMSPVNEKIEQALKPLGIPVVSLQLDALEDYPAAFRFLGDLFGLQQRAQLLTSYAEETLSETARVRSAIPDEKRVSVYYAEGPDGLSTECHTSVHAQLIPLSGGENVHRCSSINVSGMQKVSMEQVLHYDPQVIVAHEPLFFSRLQKESAWRNIRAVRDGRVYRIPRTPLNWFDRPPSFMRLLGLKWMMHQLHSTAYPLDLINETRHFYQLFLNVNLDEAATRKLLEP